MNTLRGSFFDTKRGRVAYDRMKASKEYKDFVALTRSLKRMDLNALKSRDEQVVFWINLYNVIVIHGVVELGIRESVKEVRNFFKRIEYQVGELLFSPDDMEHGILRGNALPPYSLFRVFKGKDKRLELVIKPPDPRIHFALACAAASCPPIGFYTAENLEGELTLAAETFLNFGGIKIDRRRNLVSLSRIFKWYGEDFGGDKADILKFIGAYVHKKEDRNYLEEYSKSIKVRFQDYDWRLNRY